MAIDRNDRNPESASSPTDERSAGLHAVAVPRSGTDDDGFRIRRRRREPSRRSRRLDDRHD